VGRVSRVTEAKDLHQQLEGKDDGEHVITILQHRFVRSGDLCGNDGVCVTVCVSMCECVRCVCKRVCVYILKLKKENAMMRTKHTRTHK
jgi:hypothetical protein